MGTTWDPWKDCLSELPAGLAEASWGAGGGVVSLFSHPLCPVLLRLSPLQVITADILHSSSDPPSRTEAAAGLCVMRGTRRGFLESPINPLMSSPMSLSPLSSSPSPSPCPPQPKHQAGRQVQNWVAMKSQRLRQVKCPKSCLQGGLEHQRSKWRRLWGPRRQTLETCVNRGKKKETPRSSSNRGRCPWPHA